MTVLLISFLKPSKTYNFIGDSFVLVCEVEQDLIMVTPILLPTGNISLKSIM